MNLTKLFLSSILSIGLFGCAATQPPKTTTPTSNRDAVIYTSDKDISYRLRAISNTAQFEREKAFNQTILNDIVVAAREGNRHLVFENYNINPITFNTDVYYPVQSNNDDWNEVYRWLTNHGFNVAFSETHDPIYDRDLKTLAIYW